MNDERGVLENNSKVVAELKDQVKLLELLNSEYVLKIEKLKNNMEFS